MKTYILAFNIIKPLNNKINGKIYENWNEFQNDESYIEDSYLELSEFLNGINRDEININNYYFTYIYVKD